VASCEDFIERGGVKNPAFFNMTQLEKGVQMATAGNVYSPFIGVKYTYQSFSVIWTVGS